MRHLRWLLLVLAAALLEGCSSTKHVPDGQMLLDKVSINIVDAENTDGEISTTEMINFLRQQPNHKVLGGLRLQLATYSLAGNDSTRWYNRWLKSIGQPPVIYSKDLTDASARQLRLAMINRGYMGADVEIDTIFHPDKKKAEVRYNIIAGQPHTIKSLKLNVHDADIMSILKADTSLIDIAVGDKFDRNRLDEMRSKITARLHNEGYYAFNREYITFTADTVRGSKEIALTLNLLAPGLPEPIGLHRQFFIKSVTFITEDAANAVRRDTVDYRGMQFVYGPDHYILPATLYDMCFIEPGMKYSEKAIDRTYSSLARLSILRFINIELKPAGSIGDIDLLNAEILISRNKKQSVSVELEGTNSAGDLGFGIGATYQNRNLTHRSELLSVKFRGSYESLSGNLEGFINKRFTEFSGETGLTFPKFMLPLASRSFKKRIQATTEFTLSFNWQERPEYTRVIAGGSWRWKWNSKRGDIVRRHTFDLVDINYVRLPRSTIDFLDQIAPSNPLLRYSYEDHFIMRLGYSFYKTNRRIPTAAVNSFAMQPSITSVRASVETAGNILEGISALFSHKSDEGVYKVFGIQFAQYVKGSIDYTYTLNLNSRHALAFRAGGGIAYPYGNSSMVPFEKRFYAGGANGVRGWSVRTLGPGSYDSQNSVIDFINQCGDISLILSSEYRAKLFWVLEGALFVDAGNIWTIHNYPNQPGGMFKFNKFYKEIAAAYGLGLRFDFTYFLIRFDLGFKAYNPAMNQQRWPIAHMSWHRDATFHFAVGYPF